MTTRIVKPRFGLMFLVLAIAAVLVAIGLIAATGEALGQGKSQGQGVGQNNGQGTPLVLAKLDDLEAANQVRFEDIEANNQARFVAIDTANQARFVSMNANNQTRTNFLDDLIETRVQEVKTLVDSRSDDIDDQLGDIDALLFDTHLVDELDMEITACANLGTTGGAEFAIQGETIGKGLGRLGALVYGNGGVGQG